jgi:hypothetical protein
MQKLDCTVCQTKIVCEASPSTSEFGYHLLQLKNKGGLVIPSDAAVKVVLSAERYLRLLSDIKSATGQINTKKLVTLVKIHIGSEDIFKLGDHVVESQFGIDNHHYRLITLMVSTFCSMRQHHIAKLHTQQLQKGSVRKKFAKTVLFMGH